MLLRNILNILILLSFFTVFCVIPAAATPSGTEDCISCHNKAYLSDMPNPHKPGVQVEQPGNLKECAPCHTDVLNKAISSPYPHSIARDQCVRCHIVLQRGPLGSGRWDPRHGYGFLPERFSTLDVCVSCHKMDSHTIDRRVSRNTSHNVQGLPTIENGRITCVTCHFPHGGENIHLVRAGGIQDLCSQCHEKRYQLLGQRAAKRAGGLGLMGRVGRIRPW